ncbi:PfkB family carbohydrate kinase [Leifsonia sp. H3M29-4]|uniref:PfkB family carbohydrate kinase n=1 Tax=Salinibacterium metalliresistens TaxID=3031321 RepID=UPI0023DA1BE2|nr:PfkB family carbohydrate kinase [Salinibacterium metalliresistens]MDF1478935.1 PfkB family carbohydrate kinase [Salinibacterium metalliresistens]
MPRVVIFAPSPVLTVTIEDHPDGPEVHLHAGGQGVWQARMLLRMGVEVTMCSVLTGESGRMLHHLLEDEGIGVVAVDRTGRGAAYVHDRRGGERLKIVETGGEPISRHDLDELYGITLGQGLGADLVILSGPASKNALPADVYRRLAADLRSGGRRVIVDLAGDRLTSALAGGVELVKVSDEELVDDGRISAANTANIVAAMRELRREGADAVIVTRAHEPSLVMTADAVWEVTTPTLMVTDMAGAGDSLTAGIAAALAAGEELREAVALGAAAGALNVTRHGLGTGDPQTIAKLRELVKVRTIDAPVTSITQSISLDELAAKAREQ